MSHTPLRLAAPLLLGLAAAAPAGAACNEDSWIAGSVEICDGALVYRDYVYDDYGASVGDPFASSITSMRGKVRYDRDINSADLVNVRLSVDGSELVVRFELNTLRFADSTFGAIAIDTDNNPATGGGAWPGILAVEQPHGSGAGLPLTSDGWEVVHVFEQGNPDTNTIEGRVPLPAGDTWRVQAVTGIRDRRITMNVGFRTDDGPTLNQFVNNGSNYFEAEQAAALTGQDISQWGATVEVQKLIDGVTEPAPPATGYHQRVYTSQYTIAEDPVTGELRYDQNAEGMTYEGVGNLGDGAFDRRYNFVGPRQPYGIYIPEQPGPHGLWLAIHGANQTHSALSSGPGMWQNIGEAYNNIVITPLGRGHLGWYGGPSERDVLDAMADVEANYPVDTNRRISAGYSMGGYGAMRMAHMYPHLFAGFVSWEGAILEHDPFPLMRTRDFLKNNREVPGAMLYAAGDELVRIDTDYLPLKETFHELQNEGILYLHPAADHFSITASDDWRKETAYLAGRTLEQHPKQVTYRTYPAIWVPEVGVVHDTAYWVSGIRGVDTSPHTYVDVDVTTFGCGGELPMTERLADSAGPNPQPWVAEEYGITSATPLAVENRIEASLSNVAELTIDVNKDNGACLRKRRISYRITTDTATTVLFSDGRRIELPGAGTYAGKTGKRKGGGGGNGGGGRDDDDDDDGRDEDDDDFDDDGVRDDEDEDDDNDGRNDDEDDDDDNDGVRDDDDEDDDNDGIRDEYDSQSHDESVSSQRSSGASNHSMQSSTATVLLMAVVESADGMPVQVQIRDANGLVVAQSVPTANGAMATTVPLGGATYTAEVLGGAYDVTLVRRDLPQ